MTHRYGVILSLALSTSPLLLQAGCHVNEATAELKIRTFSRKEWERAVRTPLLTSACLLLPYNTQQEEHGYNHQVLWNKQKSI